MGVNMIGAITPMVVKTGKSSWQHTKPINVKIINNFILVSKKSN